MKTDTGTGPALVGIAALTAATGIIRASQPVLSGPDAFWHWDMGRRIVRDGLPDADPYSFLTGGREWILNQWGTEAIFGLLDRVGGLTLVAIGVAALVAAAIAVAGVQMYRRAPALPTVALLGLVLLASQPGWTLRGSLFTLLLLPILLGELDRERPRALAVGLLIAAWANLHAGFLLAIAICLIHGTGALIVAGREHRVPLAKQAAQVVGVAALAGLATPYGPRLMASAVALIPRGGGVGITEWQPTSVTAPLALPFTILVATVLVSLAVSATRDDLADTLVVVAVILFGLSAIRNIAPAAVAIGVVGAPYVNATARTLLGHTATERRTVRAFDWGIAAGVAAIGLVTIVVLVPRSAAPAGHVDNAPLALIQRLDQLDRPARVVAPSVLAPAIATLTGPSLQTSVDGRLELFTDNEIERQRRVEEGAPGAAQILTDWCVTDVIAPLDAALHTVLVADDSWSLESVHHSGGGRQEEVAWFTRDAALPDCLGG